MPEMDSSQVIFIWSKAFTCFSPDPIELRISVQNFLINQKKKLTRH